MCGGCGTTNGVNDVRCGVCAAERSVGRGTAEPFGPGEVGGAGDATIDATIVSPVVPVYTRDVGGEPGWSAGSAGTAPMPGGTVGPPTSLGGPGTIPGPPHSGGTGRTAALVAALALLAVLVGVGAFLLVGGGDDSGADGRASGTGGASDRDPSDDADLDSGADDDLDADRDDEVVSDTTDPRDGDASVVVTTEPRSTTRSATLWAGQARLRDAPNLTAHDTVTFENREGMPITVIGPMVDGWLEVEADGSHGYLYAGLVVPPEADYCVALIGDSWPHSRASTRVVVSLRSDAEGYHAVILPEGDTVWVLWSDFKETRCS